MSPGSEHATRERLLELLVRHSYRYDPDAPFLLASGRRSSTYVDCRATTMRGEAMELVVADTGAGIGAADLERLGRPYEQAGDAATRSAGTGLGLSLVRAFAELHGGEMILESRVGEGTTVTVSLPVLLSAQGPVPAPAETQGAATIH